MRSATLCEKRGCKNPVLYLMDDERRYVNEVAAKRWDNARRKGFIEGITDRESSPVADVLGTAGELAVATWFGYADVASVVYCRETPDPGYDMLVPNWLATPYVGQRVDVKTRSKHGYWLMQAHDRPMRADIALLCWPAGNGWTPDMCGEAVECAGWVTCDEFEDLKTLWDKGHTPAFIVPDNSMLRPLHELTGDDSWS